MHRMLMTAVALSAALLIGTGAFAQVPADPNNPNENVPEKYNYTPYGENIKLDMAKKIADAAMAEAVKRNWPMCISVVDTSGELVYFEKMDECQYASINISQHTARAAAILSSWGAKSSAQSAYPAAPAHKTIPYRRRAPIRCTDRARNTEDP